MRRIVHAKPLWLVLLTFVVLFLHWSNFDGGQMSSVLSVRSNDTNEHLGASDNLIENGTYSLDGETPYAARMPGYAFPYVFVRAVFDQSTARFLLIILQIVLYALAVVLSYRWLSERYGAGLAFSAMAKLVVFNYVTHVHFRLLPVSLALSVVMILLYLHHRILRADSYRNGQLLLFGSLLTWLVFLRPFFLPIALLWPLVLLWQTGRWRFKPLLLLFLPFAVVESGWIARNYAALGSFVPLQTTFTSNDTNDYYSATATKRSVMHLRPFIAGFGGSNVWYFPGTHMDWFLSADDIREAKDIFPKEVFNAGIEPNELDELKRNIARSYTAYSPELEQAIADSADVLTKRLKGYSWFNFYVTARVKALVAMTATNVTQDWPMRPFSEASIPGKVYRVLCVLLWALVFGGGLLIGIVQLARRRSFELILILYGITFIFVYLVEFLHYQYFVFAWVAAFFLWMDVMTRVSIIQRFLSRIGFSR